MQITGVSLAEFCEIVEAVSAARYAGNVVVHDDSHPAGKRIQARLRVLSSRGSGARRSASGHRTVSACWHAYRDVLAEMFHRHPDAVVRVSYFRDPVVYKGRGGFEATYPGTGSLNMGSLICPVTMPDLCDCDEPDNRYAPPPLAVVVAASVADSMVRAARVIDATGRELSHWDGSADSADWTPALLDD